MPPVAHSALVTSILISALGAVVTCLLVARYGLTNDEDIADPRRVIVVRVGHAVAVVCFAASAILAMSALARSPRPAAGSADPRVGALAQRLAALEARLDGADRRLSQTSPRLERVEAQMGAAEEGLRRLGDDLAQLRARPGVERPIDRTTVPERRTASASPVAMRPARRPGPVAAPQGSATSAAIAAHPTDTPRPPVIAPLATPAAPPHAADVAAVEKKDSAVAERKEIPGADRKDLSSHVKRDWLTIKRGFANAGADFRTAIDELGRNLRGGR